MHQCRPLHEYDLTCPKPPTPPQPQLPSGASVLDAASLPPCFTVGSLSPTSNVLPSPQPHLVNPVLSFMKAFHLRSDKDSIKRVVADRFSCTVVDSAKKDLWSFCSDKLKAANLPFQARRDSDRRSHLTADIEDLIHVFDALDSSDSIPPSTVRPMISSSCLLYVLIQLQNRSSRTLRSCRT